MKKCSTCKKTKQLSDFYKNKSTKDGLEYTCKSCRSEYKQYNREKIAEYQKDYRERNKEYFKDYYNNNKEKFSEHNKSYYQNNKEDISKRNKEYKNQNREKLAEYQKERRKTDPQFKLACNLRSRLTNAIKNGQKSGSAVRDLGCSIQFLISYFDSYSMDRYGIKYSDYPELFDIDHYKPLSTFNLSNLTDFRVANNWLNLRPLLKKENLQKSDRQLSDQQHCDFLFFTLIDLLKLENI